MYDKRAGREALDGRGNQLWAYVDKPREWDAWELDAAYAGDGVELTAREVRVVEEGPHRAAIRGERPVTHTDFVSGVRYMQFTEAVARSSRHQSPVTLPLKEFSNPSL